MKHSIRFLRSGIASFLLFIISCHPQLRPSGLQFESYDVRSAVSDTAYESLLSPYRKQVEETMNDIVADLPVNLVKSLPDGTLGNFMADAYLVMAREKVDSSAELAYMNHGGIRRNGIAAGPLRKGAVYELMPFDNLMVVQKVSGQVLQKFLDHIAEEGGGGVAGLTMKIQNKKAVSVKIQGQPIDMNRVYTVVNSDYVINGGGRFLLFKDLPRNQTGYLLRDAILDYCAFYRKAGKPLPVDTQKRITHD
jgi:2',3'-cyclic-nucleotide 2'-phosphodiesterase (5'-nucleotidase family)